MQHLRFCTAGERKQLSSTASRGKNKEEKSVNTMRDKTEAEAAKKKLCLWQMLTVTGDFLRIQIYFLVQNICTSTVVIKKSLSKGKQQECSVIALK